MNKTIEIKSKRSKNEFKQSYIAQNNETNTNSMDIDIQDDNTKIASMRGQILGLKKESYRKKRKLNELQNDINGNISNIQNKTISINELEETLNFKNIYIESLEETLKKLEHLNSGIYSTQYR